MDALCGAFGAALEQCSMLILPPVADSSLAVDLIHPPPSPAPMAWWPFGLRVGTFPVMNCTADRVSRDAFRQPDNIHLQALETPKNSTDRYLSTQWSLSRIRARVTTRYIPVRPAKGVSKCAISLLPLTLFFLFGPCARVQGGDCCNAVVVTPPLPPHTHHSAQDSCSWANVVHNKAAWMRAFRVSKGYKSTQYWDIYSQVDGCIVWVQTGDRSIEMTCS